MLSSAGCSKGWAGKVGQAAAWQRALPCSLLTGGNGPGVMATAKSKKDMRGTKDNLKSGAVLQPSLEQIFDQFSTQLPTPSSICCHSSLVTAVWADQTSTHFCTREKATSAKSQGYHTDQMWLYIDLISGPQKPFQPFSTQSFTASTADSQTTNHGPAVIKIM